MSESWMGFLRRMSGRHPEASILRSIGGYNASDTGKQIRERAARPEGRHGHLTADDAQRYIAMRDEWHGLHNAGLLESSGEGWAVNSWEDLGNGGRRRKQYTGSASD